MDRETKRVGRNRGNVKVEVGAGSTLEQASHAQLTHPRGVTSPKGPVSVDEHPLKVHPEGTAAYGTTTLEQRCTRECNLSLSSPSQKALELPAAITVRSLVRS